MEEFKDPVFFQQAFFTPPHEKQRIILASSAKNKIIAAGRRFGKSKLVSREWLRGALSLQYSKQVIIAPIFKQSLIDFDIMKADLHASGLISYVSKIITSPYPKIVFVNGSFINFGSADNPDSIRGMGYDRICLEEAGLIPDSAMPAIRPLSFDTGAPLWKIGTPNGKNHFFDDFISKNADYESFQFTSYDNPYISREEVDKEIEKYGKGSLYVRTEIMAEFLEDINAVFPWKDVDACKDASLELLPYGQKKRKYVLGADLAKYEDFTVIVVLDITEDIARLVYFERFNRRPWQYVAERIGYVGEVFQCLNKLLDSTGLGDPVLEQVQRLTNIVGFKFSKRSKYDLINYLAGFIINHRIRYPNIPELVEELKYFEYVKTEGDGVKMEAQQGYHDDIVCALGLALMAGKNADAASAGYSIG